MSLFHISEVLNKVFIQSCISEERTAITDLWQKQVGKYAKETELISLKGGTLLIGVSNHVLLNELVYKRSEFIKYFNAVLKKEKIKEIRFRIQCKG